MQDVLDKELATKPNDLHSVCLAEWMEKADSYKLFSDFHTSQTLCSVKIFFFLIN